MASPDWLYSTVQVPEPLVIVMTAEPAPPPVQTPLVVIETGNPELAVAATGKLAALRAVAGADVVTVIVWSDFWELTVSLNCGAAL